MCRLSPTHTKKLLKRIPVVDVHKVLTTSAIDIKSSVHSITHPSSHGARPRILYCHFVVISITCILIYMPEMFKLGRPCSLLSTHMGPIPRILFEIMKEKMERSGATMLQRMVYTLIKFQGP